MIALGIGLPAPGCGLFRRRRETSNNVSTSVQVAQTGRDTSTLSRDEYEALKISSGTDKARRWFVLSFPVGAQASADEVEENAYYQAVGKVDECDALLMPHARHRRVIIPLLLVNVVIYEADVQGRCISIKDDEQLAGNAPATRERTAVEPAAAPEAVEPAEPAPAVAAPAVSTN